ncbi:MAG: 1-aminocyclopropane-1-carboxylate deaminase/D-cysteine desulfhydrase [Gammaproteobacteria bacterium]
MISSVFDTFLPQTPVTALSGSGWQQRVFIKREDLRDLELGGNKWCKLAGHLVAAREQGFDHVLSVGGAWSNHLHALALAGRRFGVATTGLVRGEPTETPMLADARSAGMQIHFVPTPRYRQRNAEGELARLAAPYPRAWLVPEGGGGAESMPGLARLAAEIEAQFAGDVLLAVPVGSGTTLAGLVRVLPARFQVWGFQAFHDPTLASRLTTILAGCKPAAQWALHSTQGMRSHRRMPASLARFMARFEMEEQVPLDPVYMVRMMDTLSLLLEQGHIPSNVTLVALHTGGLQGRRGHGLALAA